MQRTSAIVYSADISVVDFDRHGIQRGGVEVQKVAEANATEEGRLRVFVGLIGTSRVAVELDVRYRGVWAGVDLGAGTCDEGGGESSDQS
jgi:hypothetical protein